MHERNYDVKQYRHVFMNGVRTITLTPYYDRAMERNINFILITTVCQFVSFHRRRSVKDHGFQIRTFKLTTMEESSRKIRTGLKDDEGTFVSLCHWLALFSSLFESDLPRGWNVVVYAAHVHHFDHSMTYRTWFCAPGSPSMQHWKSWVEPRDEATRPSGLLLVIHLRFWHCLHMMLSLWCRSPIF